MSEVHQDSQSDERTTEAYTEWAECMAEEGYDFANPQEAQQSIFDLTSGIPYDEKTGAQDEAALAEIREQEIATAVADRTCQDSTGAARTALEAQFAIEQEFIDAHKDELDAMIEKAAQVSPSDEPHHAPPDERGGPRRRRARRRGVLGARTDTEHERGPGGRWTARGRPDRGQRARPVGRPREAALLQIRQREEALAACMQEQGFEYVPQVPALEDLAVGAGPGTLPHASSPSSTATASGCSGGMAARTASSGPSTPTRSSRRTSTR